MRVADGAVDGPPGIVGAPDASDPGRERRGRAASGVLPTLPGSSPLHRLWAGTKVAVLLAMAVTLAIDPSWSTLAGAAAVLLVGAVAARLPWRAVPRPPRWLLLWLLPAVLVTLGTRPPLIEIGGTSLSLGGLGGLVLLLGATLVSVLGTALLVATTPLGAFPPPAPAPRPAIRSPHRRLDDHPRAAAHATAARRRTHHLAAAGSAPPRRTSAGAPPGSGAPGVRTALLPAHRRSSRRRHWRSDQRPGRVRGGRRAGRAPRPPGFLAAAVVAAILAVALAV